MKRLLPFIALAAVSVLSVFSCQQELEVIRVGSVSLSKSALELTVGEQASLDVTISPDNATNKKIRWSSSKESVATITPEGIVEAVSAGTAFITATSEDSGVSAKCEITVKEKAVSVTGEATHISCRNAKLSGKVTLSQTSSTNLSFGVLYSTSSGILLGSATQLEAKDFDADYNYTIDTGVLEPETTYYYRSYIIQNDEVEYGQTKSFKTLALSSMIQTLDASDVVPKEATLNAMLDLTDCNYSSIEYGFELTPEGGQAKTLKANNQAGKAFSYRDETLVKNTGYSYAAYVKLDDVLYKGEVKSFTTLDFSAIEFQAGSIFIFNDLESDICNLVILEQGLRIDETSGELSGTGNTAYFILTSNGGGEDELAAGTYLSNNSTIKAESMIFTSPEEFAEMSGKAITDATLTVSRDTRGEEIYYSGSFEFSADGKKFSGSFKDLVNSVMSKELPTPPPPTLVDLGLSVLWASCNLGASKPTEYGGHYQWAGTEDVSDTGIYLDWSNCPYYDYASGWLKYNTDPSYGTVDNKTVLEAMDDAATFALGGNWRIPTDTEWSELRDNCSWTWTTIDGVNGYKVQSKKSGYTDKWIFLPAAGERGHDNLYGVGSYGFYWSSSLYGGDPDYGYLMSFDSGGVGSGCGCSRCAGQSVRPVSE